jgi:TonB family protein
MIRAISTSMTLGLALLAGPAIGCGGGKQADTTPSGGGGGGGGSGGASEAPSGGGGDMIPPEKMDEVTRILNRKGAMVSHCLAIAVDNKELPRSSRGKVTVEIVISPSGRAESVKIVRASLQSRSLDECIVHQIQEIPFPELPRPYETSHTYGFEAM